MLIYISFIKCTPLLSTYSLLAISYCLLPRAHAQGGKIIGRVVVVVVVVVVRRKIAISGGLGT